MSDPIIPRDQAVEKLPMNGQSRDEMEKALEDTIAVKSSNLKEVAYDRVANMLQIEFHGGRLYWYADVPESRFYGLLRAASKGKYHHKYIKWEYRYARVE